MNLKDYCELRKTLNKGKPKKNKGKKNKKCRRKVEETKETPVAEEAPEPTIQEEDVNETVRSEDSEAGLIKKTQVVPSEQVSDQQVAQAQPLAYHQGYPQTIQIGGQTFMAVRACNLPCFQRNQVQYGYVMPKPSTF